MNVIEVRNVKSGHISTIELPSVSREAAERYVARCNGEEMRAMRTKMNIGEMVYSLRGE